MQTAGSITWHIQGALPYADHWRALMNTDHGNHYCTQEALPHMDDRNRHRVWEALMYTDCGRHYLAHTAVFYCTQIMGSITACR